MKSKHYIAITGCVRWLTIFIFVEMIVGGATTSFVMSADGWTRGRPLVTGLESEATFDPFVLNVWSGDGTHVYGLCAYYNAKTTPVTITGNDAPNGYFYPDVVNQVSNVKDGKWQTLETPLKNPGKSATLIVEGKGIGKSLRVDLDVFVPLIGKIKYGRLLLRSGESAVFQIDDLQSPEKMTESSSDSVRIEK